MSTTTIRRTRGAARVAFNAAVLSIMAMAIVAGGRGISAAKADEVGAEGADTTPVTLAGRWSGPRYSFSMRAPVANNCGGKPCQLTYDIVACDDGWCGIAVTDERPCGAIGLRMAPNAQRKHRNAFSGRLELAKGSAPYTIEAWYAPPAAGASDGAASPPRLRLAGDTGGELLIMRRSFPFQAELARVGDAQCTLAKATS